MKNIVWTNGERSTVAKEFVKLSIKGFSTLMCLEKAMEPLNPHRIRSLVNTDGCLTTTTILKSISKEITESLHVMGLPSTEPVTNSWTIHRLAYPDATEKSMYVDKELQGRKSRRIKQDINRVASIDLEKILIKLEPVITTMLDSIKTSLVHYLKTDLVEQIHAQIKLEKDYENEAEELNDKEPEFKVIPRVETILNPVVVPLVVPVTESVVEEKVVPKEQLKLTKNANLPTVLIVGLVPEQEPFVQQAFSHIANIRTEKSYNSGLLSVIQKSDLVLASKRACSDQTLAVLKKHSKVFNACENLAHMKEHLEELIQAT